MANFRAADRYAKSIIELAHETGVLDAVHTDMQQIEQAAKASRPLRNLLDSPVVGSDTKRSSLEAVFPDLAPLTRSFIDIVLRKKREAFLPQIAASFHKQFLEMRGVASATLTSAQKLSPELQDEIVQKLADQLGQKVEVTTHIDPSLIGGFVLRVGDRQVDASVANQIQSLKKQLISPDYIKQY